MQASVSSKENSLSREVLVGGDVAVREHHALGLAGGAGGVDERGEVVGLDGADQGIEDRDRGTDPASSAPARILEKAMAPSGALPSMMRMCSSWCLRADGVQLVELLAGGDDGDAAAGIGEQDGDLLAGQASGRWGR